MMYPLILGLHHETPCQKISAYFDLYCFVGSYSWNQDLYTNEIHNLNFENILKLHRVI